MHAVEGVFQNQEKVTATTTDNGSNSVQDFRDCGAMDAEEFKDNVHFVDIAKGT